jgi:hypothetical protein
MLYVRGDRRNYDNWAAAGCEGWSFDEVLPYFKKSEYGFEGNDPDGYHGKEGFLKNTNMEKLDFASRETIQRFVDAGVEAGLPSNEGKIFVSLSLLPVIYLLISLPSHLRVSLPFSLTPSPPSHLYVVLSFLQPFFPSVVLSSPFLLFLPRVLPSSLPAFLSFLLLET